MIPVSNFHAYQSHIPARDALTFRAMVGNSKVALNKVGLPYLNTFYYKLKGSNTWQPYTLGDYINLSLGLYVSFSGTANQFSLNITNYYRFYTSGAGLNVLGDITSLSNKHNSCYIYTFYSGTNIINASKLILSADILITSNYQSMFGNCYSLTAVPELPATKLAGSCYYHMFSYCTNLKIVPKKLLPATTLANSCYSFMFKGCTSLTTALELPATTLANSCYLLMFYGCTNLIKPPSISATTIANESCKNMFWNCTSLSTAPLLPATTLNTFCYQSMFYGCTSLLEAPVLPATKLANSCYDSMFSKCTSLSTVPSNLLPATELALSCYSNMFADCTALTSVPVNFLPATNLTNYCYSNMFQGCTNLIEINLSASTLTLGCYYNMFYNCSSLSSIKVGFDNWYDSVNATTNWVNGVAKSGNFECPDNLLIKVNNSHIPNGWTVNGEEAEEGELEIIDYTPLTFIGKAVTNAVRLSSVGNPTTVTLQYSKNGGEWTNYTINTLITLSSGETVAFSGNNSTFSEASGKVYHFNLTGQIEASGNIQSLLNFSNTVPQAGYYAMFSGCTQLIKAPLMPATIVNTDCYNKMFSGCTNLVTAPSLLPATIMPQSCYKQMFANCTHLIGAPVISATTFIASQSMQYMFDGCTSLTSIEVEFTSWPSNSNTQYWLSDVSSTGTFICPIALGTNASIARGKSNCPTNWTVINK